MAHEKDIFSSLDNQVKILDRRGIFGMVKTASLSTMISLKLIKNAFAHDDIDALDLKTRSNRPYASNEVLLPAIRVKFAIDDAIQLIHDYEYHNSENVDANSTNKYNQQQKSVLLMKLENILLKPQNYTQALQLQGVPRQPAKQYLESYKPMSGDLPFQLYLIKNGDVSTWKDLKRKEKDQERVDEIRAAFNAYTDALSFSGDSYLLNVDSKTKSNMIREDKLPALKQVITSDMGLRYLYRNQILTAMDDAKAELQYQLSIGLEDTERSEVLDLKELLNLLTSAQQACGKWLTLIDDRDVEAAIDTVVIERIKTP